MFALALLCETEEGTLEACRILAMSSCAQSAGIGLMRGIVGLCLALGFTVTYWILCLKSVTLTVRSISSHFAA